MRKQTHIISFFVSNLKISLLRNASQEIFFSTCFWPTTTCLFFLPSMIAGIRRVNGDPKWLELRSQCCCLVRSKWYTWKTRVHVGCCEKCGWIGLLEKGFGVLLSVLFGILNYVLFFINMVVVPCCLSLSHDLYEFTCLGLGFKVQNSGL